MDRLSEIRARCDAGRLVHITDVKYLLSEVEQLTSMNQHNLNCYISEHDRAEKAEAENKQYHDRENYPCYGYDCYERGNYHAGCSACPYYKSSNLQTAEQEAPNA